MFRHTPPTATPFILPHLGKPLAQSVPHFQSLLAEYFGAPCFCASSGRTALYLLLQMLVAEKPHRTEVVMPAYTCPALAKVTIDVGLRPLFIDISPHTFAFDLTQLAENLSERTLAIIVVHPFGIPLDVHELIVMAEAVGAVMIEDAAQSMGAKWDDKLVGTRGDFGLFSLGPGKALSAGGGGVLCVNNLDYLEKIEKTWQALEPIAVWQSWIAGLRYALLSLVFHPRGWWWAARLGAQRVGNRPESLGYQLRGLTAVQGAIGTAGLPRLNAINEARRENGRLLMDALVGINRVRLPIIHKKAEPFFLRLPIVADTPLHSKHLFQAMQQANIGAGRLYQASLPQLFPQFEQLPTPGADHLGACLLTLPTHHYETQDDMKSIQRCFE